VEYFVWLRAGAPPLDEEQLQSAVAAGPAESAGRRAATAHRTAEQPRERV
jgi:hypothetical protein